LSNFDLRCPKFNFLGQYISCARISINSLCVISITDKKMHKLTEQCTFPFVLLLERNYRVSYTHSQVNCNYPVGYLVFLCVFWKPPRKLYYPLSYVNFLCVFWESLGKFGFPVVCVHSINTGFATTTRSIMWTGEAAILNI
jgi:hypothetical protein